MLLKEMLDKQWTEYEERPADNPKHKERTMLIVRAMSDPVSSNGVQHVAQDMADHHYGSLLTNLREAIDGDIDAYKHVIATQMEKDILQLQAFGTTTELLSLEESTVKRIRGSIEAKRDALAAEMHTLQERQQDMQTCASCLDELVQLKPCLEYRSS
jgi:hypothetical protein